MIRIILMLFLIVFGQAHSQDFFSEDAETSEPGKAESIPSYELNGFVRGAFFGGKVVDKEDFEMKSGYGELGLKMQVRKGSFGDGFAEIRFRRGSEFNQSVSEFNLREAYIDAYLGNLDFRLGHQITVWGRADGFNPTNNITPQNMLARSTDEDDRREGNFLVRAFYNFHPLRFEGIWVPQYTPSVLPTQLIPFPAFVKMGDADNPDANFKNSSVALKADLELNRFDGSISYFRGYMPLPGIFVSSFDLVNFIATVVTKPFKMQVLGCDFSTTLGSFGLRGEAAYRDPVEDYQSESNPHIPNPDIQYVIGLDKTKGDFSVILQYIGRVVIDFKEFQATGSPLDELELKNRMIASQQDGMSHAVFMRPALALFHETLNIEIIRYYNFTTEEGLFRPVLSYDLSDAFTLMIGGEFYTGPENTLFGTIEEPLSSVFLELKTSF
jgi:hypothetical protein